MLLAGCYSVAKRVSQVIYVGLSGSSYAGIKYVMIFYYAPSSGCYPLLGW